MDSPILSIDSILREGRKAAESGLAPSDCPYPEEWGAASQWLIAFRARKKELREAAESICTVGCL